MRIVNKCPHELKLYDEAGVHVCDVKPTPPACRVGVEMKLVGRTWEGVPIYESEYTEIEGMPPRKKDVVYVVSGLVISACPERDDFFQPGDLIRNSKGGVIGAVGISRPKGGKPWR